MAADAPLLCHRGGFWPARGLLAGLLLAGAACGDDWQGRLDDQLLRVDIDRGGGELPSPWQPPPPREIAEADAQALHKLAFAAWDAGAGAEAAAAAARLLLAQPGDPDLLGLLAVLTGPPAPRLLAEGPAPTLDAPADCRPAIGPDGAAARVDGDGRLLWSTARGRFARLPLGSGSGPCRLQPEGEVLTVIHGGRLRQYTWPELAENEVLQSILVPGGLVGRKGRILRLERGGRWTLDLPGKGHRQATGRLPKAFSPRQIWLAPTGRAAVVADGKGKLGLLLLPDGEWSPLTSARAPIQSLAWAPDGQRFVRIDAKGRVEIGSRSGRAGAKAWTLPKAAVDALAWPRHDEIRISQGGSLWAWNPTEDQPEPLPLPPEATRVEACELGSLVATAEGELRWLGSDGAPRWTSQPGLGELAGLSCDLDGKLMAAWTAEGRLALVDARDGRLRLRTPPLGPLARPVLRRDGHLLLVGQEDRLVDLWVGVFKASPDGLAARLGSAQGLLATPQGVQVLPPWPSPPALR